MTTGLWLWRKWCHVTSEAESQSYMDLFIGCSFSEFSHPSVRISSLSILLFSSICTDNWGRLSYLSLLFFGTLQSDEYILLIALVSAIFIFSLVIIIASFLACLSPIFFWVYTELNLLSFTMSNCPFSQICNEFWVVHWRPPKIQTKFSSQALSHANFDSLIKRDV